MATRTARRRAILFVHPSDEGYGADRVLLSAVEGAIGAGWEVRVLLPHDTEPGWLTAELRRLGVSAERGPLAPARRRYFTLVGLPAYLLALYRARCFVRHAAAGWRPGVIHINTSALLAAAIVGRPGDARLLWHVHEIVVRPVVVAWMFRLAPVLAADRIVAVSDAVSAWLSAVPIHRRRIARLYNGLETETVPAQRMRDVAVVAFVGRLNRWKGADVFLKSIFELAPTHPEARFVFAGDAPPGEEWRRDELDRRVSDAGLRDVVRFEGFRADIPLLMSTSDIVVVPSIWPEPFGLVTAEAMRAGCAIVASDHGAAPELLDGGRCGVLVPPNDAHALAFAIDRLLRQPALREQYGRLAKQRFESEFSKDRFTSQLLSIYEELISQ